MDVFKKNKKPRTAWKNSLKQRGQIILLYALLIPVLFLFVGVTFDLSWYYINVSRMQNAADAAAIAGAYKLIDREQSLSDFNSVTFVGGFDGKTAYEISRDTSQGDKIAKIYVEKNLAKDGSTWENDSITDLWTRKELFFGSKLLGDTNGNFESLYYHVTLEEDVPHMMLNGLFSSMNAKVSSVAQINQWMKGYDFSERIKNLGKQTYSSFEELKHKDGEDAAYERSISLDNDDIYFDKKNNRNVENFSIDDRTKMAFDDLFIRFGYYPHEVYGAGRADINDDDEEKNPTNKYFLTHRIINIDTVYPVRNYDFYMDNRAALEKLREENPDCASLPSSELAKKFAKDPPDPLYLRIESEINNSKEYTRQVIIDVNVSNMSETSDRPIVLIYEGPEYISAEIFPVILNLDADFRGILYAPNNPVVIKGNGHTFEGFVIAKEYVQLEEEEVAVAAGCTELKDFEGIFVDERGNVQYKKNLNGYQTVQPTINPVSDKKLKVDDDKTFDSQYSYLANQNFFDKNDFNLANSRFDSFNLVKFNEWKHLNKWGSANNLFTTDQLDDIK